MAKSGYVEFICRKCALKAEKKERNKTRVLCYSCQPKCQEQHFFDERSIVYHGRQRKERITKEVELLKKHQEEVEKKKQAEIPKVIIPPHLIKNIL